MRIFAGPWVRKFLETIGWQEGEAIESRTVSRRIESAQKKIEERNFEIRKNLLEYDAVMNEQRQLIYDQRQRILEGESLTEMVRIMALETVKARVAFYLARGWAEVPEADAESGEEPAAKTGSQATFEDPVDELCAWVKTTYGFEVELARRENFDYDGAQDEFVDSIMARYDEAYVAKRASLGDAMMQRVERFILLLEMDENAFDGGLVLELSRSAERAHEDVFVHPTARTDGE